MTAGQGDQHGGQQDRPDGDQQGAQPPAWPSAPAGQPPYGQPQPGQPPYGQQPPAWPSAPAGQPPYGQPQPGQPPYGQPPYGQPPYGQPPYGQQPPYPQNPYAYPPAPGGAPGWGMPAPEPMERPVTVRAGLGAYLGALVLSLVAAVATMLNWDEFLDWALAEEDLALDDPSLEGVDIEQIAQIGLVLGITFSIVMLGLQLLFVWFAWRGRNWARIVLWVLGGLTLMTAPLNTTDSGPFAFVVALGWFQILLTLVGVVLTAAKPSNEWYRFRKWQRATGQG